MLTALEPPGSVLAETFFARQQAGGVTYLVGTDNPRARALYERLGYVGTGDVTAARVRNALDVHHHDRPRAGDAVEVMRERRELGVVDRHEPSPAVQSDDVPGPVERADISVIRPFRRRCAMVSAPLAVMSR